MTSGAVHFARFVGALALVLVAALVAFATGHHLLAALIGGFGTQVVVFGTLLWVIFVDSKRRWPGTDWGLRAHAILTFRRRPYGS